jgi:hypothetical protein
MKYYINYSVGQTQVLGFRVINLGCISREAVHLVVLDEVVHRLLHFLPTATTSIGVFVVSCGVESTPPMFSTLIKNKETFLGLSVDKTCL